MSLSANPARAAGLSGHVVQLYGEDKQLLTRTVGQYLGEGLKRGDGLFVIATAEHSYAFARQLRDHEAYQYAVRQGRLVFLDAEIMLGQVMVEGQPDWTQFECVIGKVLCEVRVRSSSTAVRAYGEMVGLLWKSGQYSAAVCLEEYWNKLLPSYGFDLFCGYPIDILAADLFQTEALDALLAAHTHLLPADDELEHAMDRALEEVLGMSGAELQLLAPTHHCGLWPAMPRAEATVLWLRNNRPGNVDTVLARARHHRQALRARLY